MEEILVILSNLVFIFLTFLVVKKSKSFVFAVGGALIYYWTLLAGLYIYFIFHLMNSGFYLRDVAWLMDVFHFSYNEFYFKAFLLYSLFSNLIMLTALIVLRKKKGIIIEKNNFIDDKKVFCFFSCLILFSLYPLWKAYNQSENLYRGMSILGKVDVSTGKIFDPIYNVSKSIFVLGAGFAGFYLSEISFYTKNVRKRLYLFLNFPTIILFLLILIFISSNSSILFGVLVFFCSSLFYMKKIKRLMYLFFVPIVILFISFCVRGNIFTLSKGVNFSDDSLGYVLRSIVFNGESFAAHLSLYSILKNSMPIFFGKSFIYLINSIIPRFIYDHGTFPIYNYYANFLDLPKETGFTIHNASGWYLNFGTIGIVLGAIFFGLLWGGTYRMYEGSQSSFYRDFFKNCFICLTAYLPLYLRGGPEGIKSLFIFCFFLPFLLSLCLKKSLTRSVSRQ